MATDRMFTRFSKITPPPRIDDIPEGGFCLSAFLVISKRGDPNHILLGRLNKDAPWDHIGALGPDRAERHSAGWMLPSSHLILGESPQDAARRILDEQLGLKELPLRGPEVFSEVYRPRGTSERDHWDIEFVFLGERTHVDPVSCWVDLAFVDMARTRKQDIARSHEDVLAHVGKFVSGSQPG